MEILPYPSINDRAAQSKNTQRSRGYASVFQTNARHKAKHEKGSHHQKIQAHIIKILQNLRAVRNVSCPHTGKAKRKPIKEKITDPIVQNDHDKLRKKNLHPAYPIRHRKPYRTSGVIGAKKLYGKNQRDHPKEHIAG